jgi:hypothetical protein
MLKSDFSIEGRTRHARRARGSSLTLGKRMRRASIILTVLLSLAAAFVGTSCTSHVQQRLPAVAIAMRPVGDRPPSTEETRQVFQALQPALLRVGASVAERRGVADFVMTVSFTPATGSSGSRVTVISVEPTDRFRDATAAGDTPEAKEWRQRLREIVNWNGGEGRGC